MFNLPSVVSPNSRNASRNVQNIRNNNISDASSVVDEIQKEPSSQVEHPGELSRETIFHTDFSLEHFTIQPSNVSLPIYPGPPAPPYTDYDVPGLTVPFVILEETPPQYINPINPSADLNAYDMLLQYDERQLEVLLHRVESEILKSTMEMFALKRLKKELEDMEPSSENIHDALRETMQQLQVAMLNANKVEKIKKGKKSDDDSSRVLEKIEFLKDLMSNDNPPTEGTTTRKRRRSTASSKVTNSSRTTPSKVKNSSRNTLESISSRATQRKRKKISPNEIIENEEGVDQESRTLNQEEIIKPKKSSPQKIPQATASKNTGSKVMSRKSRSQQKKHPKTVQNDSTSDEVSSDDVPPEPIHNVDDNEVDVASDLFQELLEGSEELEKLVSGS